MNLYRVTFKLAGERDSYIVATSFTKAVEIFKSQFNSNASLISVSLIEKNVAIEEHK